MPWSQGGGPWGGGSGGGGSNGGGGGGNSPWGRPSGGGGGGGGGGPFGGGQPPNIEDLIKRSQERMKSFLPGGMGNLRGVALILGALALLWVGSGFYIVQPNELGIVLRFGQPVRQALPGWNYHLPRPIETVIKPSVTTVNSLDIGFRSASEARGGRAVTRPEEGQMLTGDENILDLQYTVFWKIKDARDYIFNIILPELTVRQASESAMREVVGNMRAQEALAQGRVQIEAHGQKLIQQILDEYKAGIEVTQVQLRGVEPPAQVINSFRDVQVAQADRERARNEAEAYRNQIVPEARGQAQRLLQEAEAYRQQVIAQAQGETRRFTALLDAYRLAPDVTKRRLYLEMMEEMLARTNKVIIDQPSGGSGVVPFLPLQEMLRRGGSAPPAQGQPAGARP
ncbi:MAG: FtsH protease activity modulator HflK [Alphaproteobacteria bacterium]|nr:FtsH protease activity modulator HflK [Alphaproteobacteria bacterium]